MLEFNKPQPTPSEFSQEDYYFIEGELLVFTEKYHLSKGKCCGNMCLHCPYQWQSVPTWKLQNQLAKTNAK
ncbi:MAG: DUF5522 domain-containing protein [Bacteroidota bacterium]|nr:DUF5522 domain-containing protein [Bacteroidota bacterium]